jgi:hypothetical protein
MEGFTTIHSPSRKAHKAHKAKDPARLLSNNTGIQGAIWLDKPLSHCHLPGIPYSYYNEEIVIIRQRTAELIEHHRAEERARVQAQARAQRRHAAPPEGEDWYTLEKGQMHRVSQSQSQSQSQWQGVDE